MVRYARQCVCYAESVQMSSDIEELACVSGEGVAMTASGSLSKSTKKSIRGTGPLSFSTRSRFPMSAPPIKGRRGGGGGGGSCH